jgi:hypothetical protein
MAIKDYYYYEDAKDYYETKVKKYEDKKGTFEGFLQVLQIFVKRNNYHNPLLPSESSITSQPGFVSSLYVVGGC